MKVSKLVFSSGIANIFEWYDYALFGLFADVIGKKFFPAAEPSVAILDAFFAFAAGYLMRPIGGIVFGILGDKFGRKTVLSASVICMSFPTVLIGVLPSYESIGVAATTLMIIARMLQGLSMGGALTGSISFIIEHAPRKYRGLAGSVPIAGICIGILLGSIVSQIIRNAFTVDQFDAWGWRIPFLFGVLILFAGLYIKKCTSETPVFKELKETGKLVKSPINKVFRSYWRDMLISIFINSTGSVLFYLQAIYLINFLKMTRHFHENSVSNLMNICYIFMFIVTLIMGYLSDKIGRRKIFVINLILIILCLPYIIKVCEYGTFEQIVWALILLSVFSATYIGPEPVLQAEFYPTEIRNTALSISYNIATCIFGGTTPCLLGVLVAKTGKFTSCTCYVLFCAIMSLVALYFYKNRSNHLSEKSSL